VQCQALLAITGAYHTMATNMLEVYTHTLPLEHHVQNLCHQAAIHIASHPPTHLLHTHACVTAVRMVKRHKTQLHYLMHAYNIAPNLIEKLGPANCNPHISPPFTSAIPKSKLEAKLAHDQVTNPLRIYSDGWIQHRRGSRGCCMYEAGAVGLTLAAHPLNTELDPTFLATIFVDNQAIVQSGEKLLTKSSHHIIRKFHRSITALKN
ncbi:hypothetical protein BKA83DRAFT_4038697, partial [Pisolithus microcarpus]